MSHFFTVVLVPKGTDDVRAKVAELLAPFDENLEVPEYDRPCYCVGSRARLEALEQAQAETQTIDAYREAFNQTLTPEERKPERVFDEDLDERWQQFIAPLTEAKQRLLASHPLREAPDPECTSCHGSGTYRSAHNPKAKWDWWVVGGRWDGEVQRTPRRSEGGFNFGDHHHLLEPNEVAVAEIHRDVIPYAVVTPDGEWHGRGEMGWFGMSSGDQPKDEWTAEVQRLYEHHSDCIAIGCDLHI